MKRTKQLPSQRYDAARGLLVNLLVKAGDEDIEHNYSAEQADAMVAMCAMDVVLYKICEHARFDRQLASEGLRSILEDASKRMTSICLEAMAREAMESAKQG